MEAKFCPTCGHRQPKFPGRSNASVTAHRRALLAAVAHVEASGVRVTSGAVYAQYKTFDLGEFAHITPRMARTHLQALSMEGKIVEHCATLGHRGRTMVYRIAPDAPSLPLVPRLTPLAEA